KEISELKTNQGLLLSRQAMMQQTLEQRLPSARPEVEVPERGSTDAAVAIAGRLTPNEDNGRSPSKKTAAQESSFEESAQLAYLRLVRGQAASPDPLYLNAEANNSLTDLVEEYKVHLEQVTNKQGTFVLFKDNTGGGGVVYPNPTLNFREHALRPVYPDLTES